MPVSQVVSQSMHSSNAVVSKLRPLSTHCILPTFLCLPRHDLSLRQTRGLAEPVRYRNLSTQKDADHLRTIFAQVLVQAGSCHSRREPRQAGPRASLRRSSTSLQANDRKNQISSGAGGHAARYSKEDYLSLVGTYDLFGSGRGDAGIPAGNNAATPGQVEQTSGDDAGSSRKRELEATENIMRLQKLLIAAEPSPEKVFSLYQRLPEPGVALLDGAHRSHLLKALAVTEFKASGRTVAYLSVLDDFRKAKIDIPRWAWNSAVSLGSTTLTKITDVEVEFALRTWKQMEFEAGVKGSEVTFNILFDVASKAGKFSLAEMIFQEMQARRLRPTRFTRVGLILHHGLRGDGDGVRQAYRDLVEEKEVVDTLVLNCVISALMSAGEPDAAQAVFERMLVMARQREGSANPYVPKMLSKRRMLGSMLKWVAREARKRGDADPASHPNPMFRGMQDMVSVAPDVRTCNILLRHYCSQGELQRSVSVLGSVQEFGVIHNGATFAHLFRGFATHGADRYTTWTVSRFQDAWDTFASLLESGKLKLGNDSKTLVIWALVGARHCSADLHLATNVYQTCKQWWQGEDNFETTFTEPYMMSMVEQDDALSIDAAEIVTEMADDADTGEEDTHWQ